MLGKSTMCAHPFHKVLSVAESEFVEFARSGKHDDQFDEGVAQCVRGANNSSDGSVTKQCGMGQVRVRGALVTRM